MEPVRFGLIGCGVIGGVHAKSIAEAENATLAAVADLREDAVRKLAEEHGVDKVYAAGDELLKDDEVEAVVLAMPTCARKDLTLGAFANGKHVLTEKPVAMCAADVEEMIAARGNLVAACCSARYLMPESAQAAAEFVASGALGAIRMVRCRGIIQARQAPEKTPPPWRLKRAQNGGGILANWGSYDIDYLMGVTCRQLKPRLALAKVWTVPRRYEPNVAPESDAETYAAGLIQCEGDAVILIERGEYMPSWAKGEWEIIGEDGSLQLKMRVEEDKKLIHVEANAEQGVVENVIWEGSDDRRAMGAGLIEDLARAIREGTDPMTPLEASLVNQKIADAIYASSEQGQAVEID